MMKSLKLSVVSISYLAGMWNAKSFSYDIPATKEIYTLNLYKYLKITL